MGFLGSLFGQQYHADTAPILNTTDANQINNAYNQTQTGLNQQQAFLQALQAQNGIANQGNVFSQQQDLASQLALQAQGGGPNPALNQLNQATGQNVANQAALMAGQRGASANVGLLARQAAQQGAGTQQQAVGQAATMRAQQQLAAQQALQNQQSQMAALSSNQVGQQAQALGGYNAAAQGQQQNLLGAGQALNQANVSNVSQANEANSKVAAQNAGTQGGILGGIGNALGSVASFAGNALFPGAGTATGILTGGQGASMANMAAHGGQITSQGVVGPRSKAAQFLAMGGNVGSQLKSGGQVPGQAHVSGDSLKNDIVDAKLSPGEIVIPRSIAQGADAPQKAAAFVQAILARQGR